MDKSTNHSFEVMHLRSNIPHSSSLASQVLLINVLENTLASPSLAGLAGSRVALLEMAFCFSAFALPAARSASSELPTLEPGWI
jgi:hypothetical protein